jgi:hypothetical protein
MDKVDFFESGKSDGYCPLNRNPENPTYGEIEKRIVHEIEKLGKTRKTFADFMHFVHVMLSKESGYRAIALSRITPETRIATEIELFAVTRYLDVMCGVKDSKNMARRIVSPEYAYAD